MKFCFFDDTAVIAGMLDSWMMLIGLLILWFYSARARRSSMVVRCSWQKSSLKCTCLEQITMWARTNSGFLSWFLAWKGKEGYLKE